MQAGAVLCLFVFGLFSEARLDKKNLTDREWRWKDKTQLVILSKEHFIVFISYFLLTFVSVSKILMSS